MKKNKDSFKELGSVMASANKLIILSLYILKVRQWNKNKGQVITTIFGSVIGSAWASTLIVYICTDNTFWLKMFFGTIAVILILMFQVMWIESLLKQPVRQPIMDMTEIYTPNPSDINLKMFNGYKHCKYRITDSNCPEYNKQYFLYPVYARLHGDGRIMFFKTTQITQTNE